MTVDKLIYEYQKRHPHGHFFDKETLRFFGERKSDMILHKGTVMHKCYGDEPRECYVLSTLQRKHPMGARRHYVYFDVETFDPYSN